MALGQLQLNGDGQIRDKVQMSIDLLRKWEPEEGYFVAFSGGKDSQCVYHLCQMAGVKFDAHYSVTSVDPPELVRFIRKYYPDVKFERQYDENGKPITMWSLIAEHTIPPTRKARYCCDKLKETGGQYRYTVTGVRWAESANRKANQGFITIPNKSKKIKKTLEENGVNFTQTNRGGVVLNYDNDDGKDVVNRCIRTSKMLINPIVHWEDEDVWQFLNENNIPHCCLYDEGFTRLGCIGCPLSGSKNMQRDFERWPRYKELYIRAFQKMIDNHPGQIKLLNKDYVPKNEYFTKESLTDETVPPEISGGGYGSTSGSGCTDSERSMVLQPLGGHGSNVVPKNSGGGVRRKTGSDGGCKQIDGMVSQQHELTTGETICEWWLNREENCQYVIFTLNNGETWADKQDDINQTLRRMKQ